MNPEPNAAAAADTTLNELSDKLTSVSLEPNEANNETGAKNWARRVSEDEKLRTKTNDSDSQNEDETKETSAAPTTNPNEPKPKRKYNKKQ